MTSPFVAEEHLTIEQLRKLKEKRILEKKLQKIIKEVAIFGFFFICVSIFAYKSVSLSSLQFNRNFQNTFVKKQCNHEIGLDDVCSLFLVFSL